MESGFYAEEGTIENKLGSESFGSYEIGKQC